MKQMSEAELMDSIDRMYYQEKSRRDTKAEHLGTLPLLFAVCHRTCHRKCVYKSFWNVSFSCFLFIS